MLLDERSQEQLSLRGKGSRGDISLQDHECLRSYRARKDKRELRLKVRPNSRGFVLKMP